MTDTLAHPAFGSADLTNCERELIHLAGSIQPHGVLLVVREPGLTVTQASVNTETLLGVAHDRLVGAALATLGGDLAEQIELLARSNLLMLPCPIRCHAGHGGVPRALQGMVHRQPRSGLIIELEPAATASTADEKLPQALAAAVGRVTSAQSVEAMSSEVVRCVRELTGYDRVMVYQFDPDGHGEVIAEARDERLDSFLGQHYPSSDIPQRARELYLRNRVRELVDVNYEPVPIVPRHGWNGDELDMSLCFLRSMSPLHLQYLRNMGVTGTLVASLVRHGKLWGLIACHHYAVKSVPFELRAACELLSEVVSTRLAALDTRVQLEAELFVRDMERRLVTAAAETGDWRDALFGDPEPDLLRPMGASGAALFFEGEVLTAGEVPAPAALRDMAAWLGEHVRDGMFQCSSLPKLNPAFAPLTATATGVLVAELSSGDGEYLMWFRKEQVRTVTWAGNPDKSVLVVGDDPRELSPRRSFAAWKEMVRDTAKPWSPTDLAIATGMRVSLVDMILQTRALRALIAQRHATASLGVIEAGAEPMILADGNGDVLLVNDAFHQMIERPLPELTRLEELLLLTDNDPGLRDAMQRVRVHRQPWRGEVRLARGMGQELPVALRADPVPGLRGDVLGYILIFTDLRERREAGAVRARLQRAIAESHVEAPLGGVVAAVGQNFDHLLSAILANTTAAMMQIPDDGEASAGALLRELEVTTRRAADLTAQLLGTVSRSRPQPGADRPRSSTASRPTQ